MHNLVAISNIDSSLIPAYCMTVKEVWTHKTKGCLVICGYNVQQPQSMSFCPAAQRDTQCSISLYMTSTVYKFRFSCRTEAFYAFYMRLQMTHISMSPSAFILQNQNNSKLLLFLTTKVLKGQSNWFVFIWYFSVLSDCCFTAAVIFK